MTNSERKVEILKEALETIINGTRLDDIGNRDDDGIRAAYFFGAKRDDYSKWIGVANEALKEVEEIK